MRIALDVDNTLHDYSTAFRVLAKQQGVKLLRRSRCTHYGAWEEGVEERQLRALYEAMHSPEQILSARPFPDAVEVVCRWAEQGHELLVVSSRAEHTREATESWLERIGIPYQQLLLSDPQTHDKIGLLVEYAVDLVIDDHPNTLVEAVAHGIEAATLLHPWTANFRNTRVKVAGSWAELEQLLEEVLSPPEQAEEPAQPEEEKLSTPLQRALSYLLGGGPPHAEGG